MPLLELQRVSKSFGGLRAVNALSFAVDAGEIVGLIGPNGSGKTTVFNLIAGVFRPDGGTLTFAGERVTGLRPHAVCRLGLGRTFQIVQPFNSMTVLDNVRVGAFRASRDPALASREAAAVLEMVGLAHKRDARPPSLTIADRKRLELARALATRPRLLLLDEVMAGLRGPEIEPALELIRSLRDEGMTIVAVEHIVKVILSVSDEVLVLHEGRELTRGKPDEVVRDERVIEAYLGQRYAKRMAGGNGDA
jgi:branched-chain amino acid transport system ATP-binding protein